MDMGWGRSFWVIDGQTGLGDKASYMDEEGDPDTQKYPRFKKGDDATAMRIVPNLVP